MAALTTEEMYGLYAGVTLLGPITKKNMSEDEIKDVARLRKQVWDEVSVSYLNYIPAFVLKLTESSAYIKISRCCR